MVSSNVKAKTEKIDYLEKIIKHVGASLNTIVEARPGKIVAGLEAENTCRFLQVRADERAHSVHLPVTSPY